jgi:valyl-tRNA synthetase
MASAFAQNYDSFSVVLQVVEQVRKYKTSQQISLGAELEKLVITGSAEELAVLQSVEDDII